jgi:hypothetical protein
MAVEFGVPKNGHQEQSMHGQPAPFTPGLPAGAQGGYVWNEPNFQFPPQQPQDQILQQAEVKFAGLNLKANVFHPSMPPHPGPPGGHFTPPVELGYRDNIF